MGNINRKIEHMGKKEVYDKLKGLEWGNIKNVCVSSWAIWADLNTNENDIDISNLKDGIRDVSMFDDDSIIEKLNTDYVFIGLNASEGNEAYVDKEKPWHSFHSAKKRGNDYKLRYALMNSKYSGSYITDVFKDYRRTDSSDVIKYYACDKYSDKLDEQFKMLKEELSIIGTPKIVAMGSTAYRFLCKFNKKNDNQYDIRRVYHYACNSGFKDYKDHILKQLNGF